MPAYAGIQRNHMGGSYPADLLAAFDILIAERLDASTFRALVPVPDFCRRLFRVQSLPHEVLLTFEESPFLLSFLQEAEPFWAQDGSGRLTSGPWVESDQQEMDFPLQASALCLQNRKFLVIELLGVDFEERRSLLQSARERHLIQHKYDRLRDEIKRRELVEQALKENEARLRSANQFQQLLLAVAATAILTVDSQGVVTGVNDEFCRLTGYEQVDVLGKSCQV
ncbi:MAG: PAS domain-containing protein, partial [Deltaproteobacteria bacterium]|nr:PAS domain-containing protein [Deltaproteobacteria bacterium]